LATLGSWFLAAAITTMTAASPQLKQNSATAAALASLRRRSVVTKSNAMPGAFRDRYGAAGRVPFPL
jgi:hypothetical protein